MEGEVCYSGGEVRQMEDEGRQEAPFGWSLLDTVTILSPRHTRDPEVISAGGDSRQMAPPSRPSAVLHYAKTAPSIGRSKRSSLCRYTFNYDDLDTETKVKISISRSAL